MKSELQMGESRSHVILRFTRQAMKDRRLVVSNFAAEVADRYLASHEIHERVVKFREPVGDTDALFAAMKHNVQIVDRYITGVVKALPCDLEESWTDALPDPYRLACQRELVRRLGFLGAVAKSADDCAHGSMADVLHEFGEFVGVSGGALSREELTAEQRLRFLREADDVIAAITTLRQQIAAGQPSGVVHPLHRDSSNA